MKMSQLKMVIREVVREEIRLGLKEILGGAKKQPVQKPKLKQKQHYSKNPILNEVLNNTETEQTGKLWVELHIHLKEWVNLLETLIKI